MRVLVTTDTVGGVWTYTETLVRSLAERGDTCLVAALGDPSVSQRASLPGSAELESAPHRLEWMEGATEDDIRAGADWIRGLAERWRPDLVHLNQFGYAAMDLGAPVMVVAHSDVYSWFREVRDEEPGPEWTSYRNWVRAGLQNADLVLAPTAYQSGMLARHYGRPADRVIHNASLAPAPGGGPRASERPFVLTAGRAWDEAKGMAVLDEALLAMGKLAPPAHVAGSLEGPGGERFAPRALHAHGRIPGDAMGRLYHNSAIYVATSLYEPFGLAPLEAAGHGCALVLSDIGSFRELWQDAAVFVEPGSSSALAGALEDLLADPRRLDALAAAAGSRARERYTVDRMAESYRAEYRKLLEKTGAAVLAAGRGVETERGEDGCRRTA